ncbi:MAG: TadE/TadG family type IV pilus assembly protein [Hyphomicrobium sp.]|jgi:Flp pilus assembly protein TadG|nr:pilus assembly protein [Hyphomicrobium sp.]
MTFTIRRRITLRQRLAIRLHQFKDNCAGVAAVEFAYLLPLLIIMTYGVIEASRAVMMHKRFQRSVAMVGDLVAREETIGDNQTAAEAEMAGIMKAAEHIMTPYDFSSLQMGVTAIEADPNNASITKVAWSYPYHAYPVLACGSNKSMPAAGMITKGNSAILVEAQYTYKPILTDLVPGFNVSVQWKDQIANAPRSRCPDFAGKNCDC